MQSPRTVFPAVTEAQFKSLSDKIQEQLSSTVKLATKVYAMKPTEKEYRIEGLNQIFTRGDIKRAFSAVKRSIADLPRYFRASMKKKPRRRVSPNSGLRKPIRVNDNMINFVKAADFGNVRGKNDISGTALNNYLNLLTSQKVTTSILLNSLFNIYVARNNLVAVARDNQNKTPDQQSGIIFGADQLMLQWFGTSFDAMERESAVKLQTDESGPKNDWDPRPSPTKKGKQRKYFAIMKDAKGKPVKNPDGTPVLNQNRRIYTDYYHQFSRNNIARSDINTIIKKNKVIRPPQLDVAGNIVDLGDDALFKLEDREMRAYRDVIEAAKTSGAQANYEQFAEQVITQLGLQPGTSGYQRVKLRGRADAETAIVTGASHTYRKEKPKKGGQ